MPEKGKEDEYRKIRTGFGGRLCSIVDDAYRLKYNEDILFTVKPPRRRVRSLFRNLAGRDVRIERFGWPADPEVCFPDRVPGNEINIFVDHSWYGGKMDCSQMYFGAFKEVIGRYPKSSFNVYRQNNNGIEKWDFSGGLKEAKYRRDAKVPYIDIIKAYRRCHIFCVTHPESAGLAAVEAAMCGAKLYVPSFFIRSFISRDLLGDGVEYSNVSMTKESIIRALSADIERGLDRERVRQRLMRNNTWKGAALNIRKILEGSGAGGWTG